MPTLDERYERLTEMFEELLVEASFEVPEDEKALIDDLVENVEFDVAFDVLIDAIREYGIRISRDELRMLDGIGLEMGLDPARWEGIPVGDNGSDGD